MVRSKALAVEPSDAEAARNELRNLGIRRSDLKIRRRGKRVLIPVSLDRGAPPFGGRWVLDDFDARAPGGSYKEFVEVPSALRTALPTSFDVVGDVAIMKLPAVLEPHGAEIGRALMTTHPHLRVVFSDHGVTGPHRIRSLRRMAGEGPPVTVHREFGIELKVDLAAAYFSPRLAGEHARIAELVQPAEKVLDATAGIGPFAIAIAKRQPRCLVTAVDINPDAARLLEKNVSRNRVRRNVDVVEDDGFRVAVEGAPWDRIIVNLPHGEPADQSGLAALLAARGWLHLTRVLASVDANDWARAFALSSGLDPVGVKNVHAYSATDALFAFDFRRPGR